MKKATIHDVAKLSGVSSTTISHIINNTRFVSDELKEKVYSAIKELRYMPDAQAKNFRKGKRRIIGVIVPYISNSFFATVIDKVEEIVSEEGYNVIVCNSKEIKEREKKYVKLLASGLVDGLVLASTLEDYNELSEILPKDFPIILVDRIIKNASCDSIVVSIYQVVYESLCELIRNGKRKIGYIVGLPHLSTTIEGINAYKQAMNDCGIEIEKDLIQYFNSENKNIFDCINTLLLSNCDGILATNSYIALKTIFYFEERNIKIGEDIKLICLNNYRLLSSKKYVLIEQPIEELGRQAGRNILRRIQDPYAPSENIVLPSTLRANR
ncbi:MAG: LacI family DNA-binding transcriptional regulator [Christensenellales bacterium]